MKPVLGRTTLIQAQLLKEFFLVLCYECLDTGVTDHNLVDYITSHIKVLYLLDYALNTVEYSIITSV